MKLPFFSLRKKKKWINITSILIKWRGKSASNFQSSVKEALFPLWGKDIVCEEFPTPEGLRIDFFNVTKAIAIEVNGRQHTSRVKHFHPDEKDFTNSLARDIVKRKWCEMNKIKLIDINYDDPISTEWIAAIIKKYAS